MQKKWNFMLDQGGTFTDIIAVRPDGKIITKKILSSERSFIYNPIEYGINLVLKENKDLNLFLFQKLILVLCRTNALLERKGAKLLFCVTKGLKIILL